MKPRNIEVHHHKRQTRDEVPNYFSVTIDGVEVYRTHYVRSRAPTASAMKIEAEESAKLLARKLKKALSLSDEAREQIELDGLALAMVPIAAAAARKGKGAIEVMHDAYALAEAFRIARHEEHHGAAVDTAAVDPSDIEPPEVPQ